jgi:signal transduction histidine kinase
MAAHIHRGFITLALTNCVYCLALCRLGLNTGRTGSAVFGICWSLIDRGVVLNTTFLVREIRRNAQHDAFINAVTHELKTPVASIRLYLETLQTRAVEEPKRQEFYRTMLEDSDRLLGTIEQILRTGRTGHSKRGGGVNG